MRKLRCASRFAVPLCLCLAAAACAAAQPADEGKLKVAFDKNGLSSLNYAGTEFLKDGRPAVHSITLRELGRLSHQPVNAGPYFKAADLDTVAVTFDTEKRLLLHDYHWGGMEFTYTPKPDRLEVGVRFWTDKTHLVADFDLSLLQLALPAPPEGLKKGRGRIVRTLDNLAIVTAACGEQKVLACCDTIWPPVQFGLSKPADAEGRQFPVVARGGVYVPEPGAYEIYPHGLPRGREIKLTFSLRFAPADASQSEVCADIYKAFREHHGPLLDWRDRRPIGAIFLPSDRGSRTEKNPRGWFKDKDLDTTAPEGRAEFKKKMLEFADRSVKVLKDVDAQGVIVWNVEGGENPHPITYIGDPRMLKILAPEMDEVADEFFQKFRDAGLRTGVCIRPTQVYYDEKKKQWSHGTGSHGPDRNPLGDDFAKLQPRGLPWWRFYPVVERMCAKIAYAKKRWGCTIFYVDTNGVFRQVGEEQKFEWMLLDAGTWKAIRKEHPDVLLIPELARDKWTYHAAYWAHAAPYGELDMGTRGTSGYIRDLFPHAFLCNYAVDGDMDKHRAALVEAVKGGDVLMFRGWFGDRQNEKIKSIYKEARPAEE